MIHAAFTLQGKCLLSPCCKTLLFESGFALTAPGGFLVAILDSSSFWMQSGLGLLALSCLDQQLLHGL